MKKLISALLCGVVVSLAACTPTAEKQKVKSQEPTTEVVSGVELGETSPTGGIEDKVPDPNASYVEIVSIYSINENGVRLKKQMNEIPLMDPQSLVDLLIEAGVLEAGTKVNNFEIKRGGGAEVGPGVNPSESVGSEEDKAELDLSSIPKSNKEDLILAAIGNTFIENYELDKLTITVNGTQQGKELSYYK